MRRGFGPLAKLGIALPALWLLFAAGIAVAGLHDDSGEADAAVILGNRVERDGRPSWILAERLETGLALHRAGRVKLLIVSGGTGAEGFDEARVMGDWLRARGVPAAAVIEDPAGVDTRATMRNVAAILRARGMSRLIVVSHFFHLPRCKLAARRAGIPVAGGVRAGSGFHWRHLYSLARETAALSAYALGGA